MFAELLIASTLQIGPFYEGRPGYHAVRPFWARESETTDVLWPVFTKHRDWWRFCFFTHYQDYPDGGYQFEIMPLWFNGTDAKKGDYWGLFPLWGNHPHLLTVYDLDFCLWPLWHRYRMPRPSENRWLTSNAVLFPFVTWRDDGSWGVWPFCGINHQRESDHRYCLWPLVTWADYRADRDTGGAGSSWMVWPICAGVTRQREDQWLFLPPLFSYAETRPRNSQTAGADDHDWRLRCPWPLLEIERRTDYSRTSVFPFYEETTDFEYADGAQASRVTRFGWRLVEIYRDKKDETIESRVFPFWKGSERHTRVWPFWERFTFGDQTWKGVLALFPITWADSVDRNWAKFWTFYESLSDPVATDHYLFWGIIRWRTMND